ncbi:MAG TPA: hypothetical protein VFW50_05370, partial [Streptosporangiaceae bacterium]|nr:hypothetical protein [Streptosporangiaceae bacterium]
MKLRHLAQIRHATCVSPVCRRPASPSDKDPARRAAETRTFGTTRREVLALADWLRCWQVPAVVMEATGDYW